jgi:hypothetical protein
MSAFIIEEFVPRDTGILLGFARVRLPSGMIFHDVGVYHRDDTWWATPASKPRLGKDGVQIKDAAGKGQWQPVVTFASKDLRDKWSSAVIEAMGLAHPEIFTV